MVYIIASHLHANIKKRIHENNFKVDRGIRMSRKKDTDTEIKSIIFANLKKSKTQCFSIFRTLRACNLFILHKVE